MNEDITYCTANCKNKNTCERNPERIKHVEIDHSYSDFSGICERYVIESEE